LAIFDYQVRHVSYPVLGFLELFGKLAVVVSHLSLCRLKFFKELGSVNS
jgi:hypothetical protein